MSQALTLARPYARAAFAVARDEGRLDAWSQALAFSAQVAADPRVSALLLNPGLGDEDAVALLAPPGADIVQSRETITDPTGRSGGTTTRPTTMSRLTVGCDRRVQYAHADVVPIAIKPIKSVSFFISDIAFPLFFPGLIPPSTVRRST